MSAWRDAVKREGRVPLFSTPWDDTASRALAAKLGLIPCADAIPIG